MSYTLPKILGRIVWKNETNYTVTHLYEERIFVFNPITKSYLAFDNEDTFNNWAYGTPIPAR